MDAIEVRDDPAQSRFEIRIDGTLVGFAEYRLHGTVADFTHTQIDEALEGRGLAGRLIGAALDATRAAGRQVRPYCPFVRAYIARHPEYTDLVPAEARARFEL
jgi:predicted GNAT family acetyltransferase